jgi:hypothetical protein
MVGGGALATPIFFNHILILDARTVQATGVYLQPIVAASCNAQGPALEGMRASYDQNLKIVKAQFPGKYFPSFDKFRSAYCDFTPET